MIDEKKIEDSFAAFEAATRAKPHFDAAASPVQRRAIANDLAGACATYKNVRSSVDAIVGALNSIGGIVPYAGRAAGVISALKNILDAMCP